MALTKQKLLHKRSSVVGRILAPSALTYGEIAVNFSSGANNSFLEIKKYDDKPALYFEHPYGAYSTTISGATAGYWSANISGITEYYDGLSIRVRLGTTYDGSWNTLNVNGLGSKIVWRVYNGRMTSHYDQWAELTLTYRTNAGSFQATATARGLISGTTYKDGWIIESAYYSDDIYRLYEYYARYCTGPEKMNPYMLFGIDENEKTVPLVVSGGTGTAKPVNQRAFRPDKIYYCNTGSAVNANTVLGHGSIADSTYVSGGIRYVFNSDGPAYTTIYLKGKLNESGMFVLSSGITDFYRFVPYDQTALTLTDYFEEGWYYIRVGRTYSSANSYYLNENNPLFYFDGTNLVEVKPLSVKTLSAATSTIANSANTLTHKLTLKQNTTTIGDWNGGADKTLTFSDSATTYAGHYTPSNNSTATTTGARITGITRDGKGHIISIATAATDNTDTATTETGHYTPTGSSTTIGSAGAGNFIKTITLDSKKHVTAITSGTALTSYTEASVTIANSGSTNASPQPIVYGAVTGGTKGHSITLQRTNKTYSASTADSATTSNSATTALSASTAGNLKGTLNIYKNGTLLTSFNGSATVSALTTDTNPSVTAGTVGTGVVTGITASGTSNHAIVGLKTNAVNVNSAKTTSAVTIVTLGSDAYDQYRTVWFSHGTYPGIPVRDTDLEYNPQKNLLKVSGFTNGTTRIVLPQTSGTIALTSDIDNALSSSVNYKGATSTVPASASTKVGDLWIAASAISLTAAQSATGAAQNAEIGDFIIARESGKWDVVQKNIDGAVTSTATSLTSGNVIIGKGNRTIGVSSYTIAKSVPSNALFTDSATTYAGHYTPSNDSTSTVSGARITGITKDGKGHIISIATAATDNTDTATTETGHYTPSTTASTLGSAGAGNFIKTITLDSKKHVLSITSGTALTSYTQSSVTAGTVGTGVVTGLTASGTASHAIVGLKTTAVQVNSAKTASAVTILTITNPDNSFRGIWWSHGTYNGMPVSEDAFQYNPATNQLKVSAITMNGTNAIQVPNKAGTFALTSDIPGATAGTVGTGVVTGLTVCGTTNHTIVGLKTTAVKVNSATTADTAFKLSCEAGTSDSYRHVWFSWDGTDGRLVYDDNFQYNPAKNMLEVSALTVNGTNRVQIPNKAGTIALTSDLTGNTDTATTESGHYTPTGSSSTLGSTAAGNFIKTITLDSKKHVTAITSGSETTVSVTNSGATQASVQSMVYGIVTGGTNGHSLTLQRTTKIASASTADSARTVISTFKVSSAATATNLQHPLHIYQNGTRIATYSGGTIVSAKTTDEMIKTATATTKAYIVGKAAVGDTSTGITHANAYMSAGALYSEGVKVSTTDTKVTDANSSGKTFLLGHATQGTNATAQTYTNVYMSAGTIAATEYKVEEKAVMKYNTTNQCIDFVFI